MTIAADPTQFALRPMIDRLSARLHPRYEESLLQDLQTAFQAGNMQDASVVLVMLENFNPLWFQKLAPEERAAMVRYVSCTKGFASIQDRLVRAATERVPLALPPEFQDVDIIGMVDQIANKAFSDEGYTHKNGTWFNSFLSATHSLRHDPRAMQVLAESKVFGTICAIMGVGNQHINSSHFSNQAEINPKFVEVLDRIKDSPALMQKIRPYELAGCVRFFIASIDRDPYRYSTHLYSIGIAVAAYPELRAAYTAEFPAECQDALRSAYGITNVTPAVLVCASDGMSPR
jgi:hypothetical protein